MEDAARKCPEVPGDAGGVPPPLGLWNHNQDPGQGGRPAAALWRPWLHQKSPAWDGEDKRPSKELAPFRHPVRLCWPRSRAFDYLYAEGKELLENFPVQATISLYEDSEESDSDWEEEEEEEEPEQRAGATPLPPGVSQVPLHEEPGPSDSTTLSEVTSSPWGIL